jgi:methylglutaconyl-CoA hydratase
VIPAAAELTTRMEGAVAWLTLQRPEKRNALNAPLIAALKGALTAADAESAVRVVAVEGAGKDFCAGADLAALHELAGSTVEENLADAESLGDLFVQLRRMRKPIVAVVRGRALAGGCGLATACDLVIAEQSARFGYPEVTIGFVPAMVMALLRRSIGEKRAFELVALGESISAADAARIGLINRVYPDGEFDTRSREFVEALAGHGATAVQLCKRLLYQQDSMSFEAAIRAGAEVNVIARLTEDARRGIERFASPRQGSE